VALPTYDHPSALGYWPPPPRQVPLRLWCHLLASPVALCGGAVFAFGMTFVLVFGHASNPVGSWRLALRSQQTQGWIEGMEVTHFQEGGDDTPTTPIYRYDFRFQLPDGTPMRGSSYTVGQQFQLLQGNPVPVTVEYDPRNPGTSRIQGTRTAPYSPWVLLVLLVPAVALLVAIGGLFSGRRRARLLRDGELVAATVTACRWPSSEDDVYLPVTEFKQKQAEMRARFSGHPFVLLGGAFLGVWTLLATVIFVFGIGMCLFAIGMLLVFPTPPRERAAFLLGITAFLVLWLVMGRFLVRSGWQGCRAIRLRHAVPDVPPLLGCAFEFPVPDGRTVQLKGPGRIVEEAETEPPQLALYEPKLPDGAVLLSGLWPTVHIGPYGEWETTAGFDAFGRLLAVLLLIAGPIAVGLLLP
jgi:hypothetical protein